MPYWVVRTACGYTVLTYTGQHLQFFTHASHVKSFVYGKEYSYIGLNTPTIKVTEYERISGRSFVDYTQSGNF